MFTNKKLLTALILSTAFTATTAMADEPTSNLLSQTDYLVASAMTDVKQDITITPMKSDEFQNDNDA